MDSTSEVMGTDEDGRLIAWYGRLSDAVRDLIDAAIRTQAEEDTIRDAHTAIEAVTGTLRASQSDRRPEVHYVAGAGFRVNGRPLVWNNAVIGLRNPIAPPLTIQRDGHRCWSKFHLGAAYEGPPGLVHGGVCALVLDHMLGDAASEGLTKPLFTGTIIVKYLRGTPLGMLRADAAIGRTEGAKTFVRGSLSDASGTTAKAEGVFIRPRWARNVR
ncbi:MAG TPA: PaaI family thioesterase [Acetobacteraceae bacterium]|nr:PaaI family thioesterase [Acetobacteraceae bacterium]